MAEFKEIRKFRPNVTNLSLGDVLIGQQEFPPGVFKTVHFSLEDIIDFIGIVSQEGPVPFYKPFSFPGATATTPLIFLTDAEVGAGRRPVVSGWKIANGINAWTEEEIAITISPTDELKNILFIEDAAGQFANFDRYWGFIKDGGAPIDNLEATFDLGVNPIGKGLQIRASGNDGSASNLEWEMWGFLI